MSGQRELSRWLVMNEEQKRKKKQLIETLLKNRHVKKFLKEHQLDEGFVYTHSGMFDHWIKVLNDCEGCLGLDFCKQPTKGKRLDLKYENFMYNEVVSCHYMKEYNEKMNHVKQYVYHDLSKELVTLSLEDLLVTLKEQPKNYISEVIATVTFLEQKKPYGLYLYGRPGVGKTYLSAALANDYARMRKSVIFVNVPNFVSSCKLMMNEKSMLDRRINDMKKVDVLFMDDIGGESVSPWIRDEILLPILNERLDHQRLTYFTSNFDYEALEKHYRMNSNGGDEPIKANRLLERIKAMTQFQEISGENRRNMKK